MSLNSQETKEKIERIMRQALSAIHVEIEDETGKHEGHAGAASGGGHFNLLVVSNQFEGLKFLDRHRMVFKTLEEEMKSEIHALSIKALTSDEWKQIQQLK